MKTTCMLFQNENYMLLVLYNNSLLLDDSCLVAQSYLTHWSDKGHQQMQLNKIIITPYKQNQISKYVHIFNSYIVQYD